MPDPLTIGGLVVWALGEAAKLGAKKVLETGIGEVVKDAYAALKTALKTKIDASTGNDLEALEKEPDSKGRQLIVAEKIDGLSPEVQAYIRTLALTLSEALRRAAVTHPTGMDLQQIEAARIALKATDIRSGTGIKIGAAKATGAFKAEVSNVGEEKR